jgi:hypothetical protein
MPRPGAVRGGLKGALWSAVIASLVLSSLSGVAEASAVAGRPGNTAWVRGAGPRSFVTPSASATLEDAYRVARAERGFELIYEVSLALFGTSPSKPVFWVLQTEQSSRAVERYQPNSERQAGHYLRPVHCSAELHLVRAGPGPSWHCEVGYRPVLFGFQLQRL